jgi:ribosomal protein S27E
LIKINRPNEFGRAAGAPAPSLCSPPRPTRGHCTRAFAQRHHRRAISAAAACGIFELWGGRFFGLQTGSAGDSSKKTSKGAMPFTFTSNGKCSKCGNESFTSSHRPADYAPVRCLACGHVTTVSNAVRTYQAAETAAVPYLNRE